MRGEYGTLAGNLGRVRDSTQRLCVTLRGHSYSGARIE